MYINKSFVKELFLGSEEVLWEIGFTSVLI